MKDQAEEVDRELKAFMESDPILQALNVRLDAILKGQAKPVDNRDRLILAERAYDKWLYVAGANLWKEAMTLDPKLAPDRQGRIRYIAACSSALAGTGMGKDQPRPVEKEKDAFRRQAQAWLREELQAWETLLKTDPAKSKLLITYTLEEWGTDRDLIGVREPKELAKLPEAERKDWEAFWREVERVLEKAKGAK